MSEYLRYSPLCDTDSQAYSRYLTAVLLYKHGISVIDDVREYRGRDLGKIGGGDLDFAVELMANSGVGVVQGGQRHDAVGDCVPVVGVLGVASVGVGATGECNKGEVVGISGVRNGSDGSFVVGCSDLPECGQDAEASGSRPVLLETCEKECIVPGKLSGNRRKRMKRKELKIKQTGMNQDNWRKVCHNLEKTPLQLSLEEKWKYENELATEKARQELEIVKLRDIGKEVKKREALVMKKTETSKVAVEKAFGTLRATGNVAGFATGCCETVVSGDGVPSLSSGSISPNSSVSDREAWALQKENADLKAELARVKKSTREDRIRMIEKENTVIFTADNFSDDFENELKEKFHDLEVDCDPLDPSTLRVKKGAYNFY